MKILTSIIISAFCAQATAGILCKDASQGIEEFYIGYSAVKGCYMTLTLEGDKQRITNILNAGTKNEKYDCTETTLAPAVVTEANVNYDPAVLEPGEDPYPNVNIKAQGGIKNLELTVTLFDPEYVWTMKNLDCVQVPDLE